jgi:hypothetical protein
MWFVMLVTPVIKLKIAGSQLYCIAFFSMFYNFLNYFLGGFPSTPILPDRAHQILQSLARLSAAFFGYAIKIVSAVDFRHKQHMPSLALSAVFFAIVADIARQRGDCFMPRAAGAIHTISTIFLLLLPK